jgi:mannosyltransferase
MQASETAENGKVNPAPSPSERAGNTHWFALSLLFAAGAAVRFLCLACKPFWFDECFSIEVARIDWRNFLHLLWWREANMSLYYVLLRIWLHFGQNPFFIRSMSAVIAAASIPAIYWLARLLYDRRVALIAAALFAFNAYDVRYAQEVRSYSLFVLLATLSSGFLIAWLQHPTRRNWRGYVLMSIMAVYAHFYALLLIAVHGLALYRLGGTPFGGNQNEPALRSAIRRAWITISIAFLPLLIFVAKTGAGPIKWIHRPGLADLLQFYEHLAGGSSWILLALIAAACVAAIFPFGRSILGRAQSWEIWRSQFLVIWLIFPPLLTALLSLARPVFLGRYMIFCLPAFLILAAAGLARLRQAWLLGSAWAAILVLCCQGISFVYGHDFDDERDASGTATNLILDQTHPGDAILFHIAETRIPYEFFRSVRARVNTASPSYSGQLGPEIVFPHHGPGLDYRDFTGKPTADLVHSVSAAHPRVWVMLMNNGPPGKPDPTTEMLIKTLPESFPRWQTWQFARVEVRLYSQH